MSYNEAKQVASITGSVEAFDAVISRLLSYTERLEELNAKISGPEPTGTVRVGVRTDALPPSIIASINERRNALVAVADRLEGIVTQLGSAL